MAERSTKHSARLDDEMADETEPLTRGAPSESHVEEWRLSEPPADGEPTPEAVVEVAAEAAGGALDDNERRRRSELAASLPHHAFPGDRGGLLRAAELRHAEAWVIALLETLPIDTRFDTPQQVWMAVGGHREARASERRLQPAGAPIAGAAEAAKAAPGPAADGAASSAGILDRGSDLVATGVHVAAAAIRLAVRCAGAVTRRVRGA